MPYTYKIGGDDIINGYDILTPDGKYFACLSSYGEESEGEVKAKLIVDALNSGPELLEALRLLTRAVECRNDAAMTMHAAYAATLIAKAIALTHDELRKRHYANLNSYRDTVEYQASPCCCEKIEGPLRTLIGNRWEIDAEIYNEALNMLPPLAWSGGVFYCCEFLFDDITAKFTKVGSGYYCEYARFPGRVA